MAAALQYLQEHKLTDYDAAGCQATEAAVDRFHALAGELRETEADPLHIPSELMERCGGSTPRPGLCSMATRRPGTAKSIWPQHEAELADYRAAKAAMNELLGGAKLPKMDALKKERRGALPKRKRPSMPSTARPRRICGRPWRSRQTLIICSAMTDGRENKAQERLARAARRHLHRDFGTICPEVQRVWGGSPTSIFAGLRPAKISECGHTRIACHLCAPLKIEQSAIDRFGYLCYTVQ